MPQAEELFRQALGIRQKREPDGLETAQTLDSLALCLQAQEKFDAAESDYRRALKIRQTLLPSDHPAIAQTINSLAWLLYTRGEFPESRELYEKALDMRKRVLGPNHILTATTMDGLGLVTAERNPPEGESLIRQALKIPGRSTGT